MTTIKTPPSRVCVVGGDLSGLTAAYELAQRGYEVTILEPGKNLGAPSLAFDADSPLMPGKRPISFLREDGGLVAAEDIRARFAAIKDHFADLKKRTFQEIGKPGLVNVSHKLHQPVGEWLQRYQANAVYDHAAQLFSALGYGAAHDIPAMYFAKLLDTIDLTAADAGVLTPVDTLKLLSDHRLRDVRCEVVIERIERGAASVTVVIQGETLNFDFIVLSVPLDSTFTFLDASTEEADLFSKIQYRTLYTIHASVEGLVDNGLTLFPASEMNSPVAYHAADEEGAYTFYAYGEDSNQADAVIEKSQRAVEKLGGTWIKAESPQIRRVFPHVASADLRMGYYGQLEALQGQNRSYYVGGLFNLDLAACNITYAQHIVSQHFAVLEDRKETSAAVMPPPARTARTVVPLQPSGTKTPYFSVAAGYGDVLALEQLTKCLSSDQPFYALQAPRDAIFQDLPSLAARYIEDIRSVRPRGPYHIGGHSVGGVIALEIAQQLVKQSEIVESLILWDPPFSWRSLDSSIYSLSKKLMIPIVSRLQNQDSRLVKVSRAFFEDEGLLHHQKAAHGYLPSQYPGKITLFLAQISLLRFGVSRWKPIARDGLKTYSMPGDHDSFYRGKHAAAFGRLLQACLDGTAN